MAGAARILILALGNPDAGDDAFGPSVAGVLRGGADARFRVIDLGLGGASALLDEIEGSGGLILMDAVRGPDLALGRLVDVDWRDPARPSLAEDGALSSHAMPVGEQLRLADLLGMLPERVRIIGVAVGSVALGEAMSPLVREAVPGAAARAMEWVGRWWES